MNKAMYGLLIVTLLFTVGCATVQDITRGGGIFTDTDISPQEKAKAVLVAAESWIHLAEVLAKKDLVDSQDLAELWETIELALAALDVAVANAQVLGIDIGIPLGKLETRIENITPTEPVLLELIEDPE